ncbi:hypothetical protein [Streptomyces sp. NPDC020917]|uniref:hypothetical protein n=1 Tax=Streptomyces sp. NPDC020917 TaxID=3365102 RepID=UPI0037A12A5E
MFPSDIIDDPLLVRSEKLIRWGAVTPMLGLCGIALTSRLLNPSRGMFFVEMVVLSLLGQALTWWGIYGVWRCRGWDSDVLFYLWMGAMLGGFAMMATGRLPVAAVVLAAPLVATFARWRMRRDAKQAGVAR